LKRKISIITNKAISSSRKSITWNEGLVAVTDANIALSITKKSTSRAARNSFNKEISMAISKSKKGPMAKKAAGSKPASGRSPVTREKLSALKPSGKKDDSFFELVHEVARQIPKGRVTSYGAIAACLGTRLSARMVGWAMNAVPKSTRSVPAHRVVNSMGLLSGKHHFSPPDKMQELLEKEGITIRNDKVVDFSKLFWDPAKEL
jgi:methylated-DNA-protein-cysteine methyltransferase related protein